MITSVDILGVPHVVKHVDQIDCGKLSGYIAHYLSQIEIAKDIPAHLAPVVLMHECIHGIFEVTGHEDYRADEDLAKCLSYGIVYLLRHNPDLVKYLCEDVIVK